MSPRLDGLQWTVLGLSLGLGTALPGLETARRGWATWATNPATLLEDYVAGGLLLLGVWATVSRWRSAWPLVLLAGAYATGMMSSSFWKHLAPLAGQVAEPNQGLVLMVKALLWAASATVALGALRIVGRPAVIAGGAL